MRTPIFATVIALSLTTLSASGADFTPEALAFFEKEVQPILKANCYKCHGEEKPKGGFSLLTREAIQKGGDLGPAVVAGKAEEGNLYKAIHWKDGLEMPPKGKLKPAEIDVLTKWIKADLPMKDAAGAAPPKHEAKGGVVTEEAKRFWAYQPVKRPAVPALKALKDQVRNPIDNFVLSKLEEKNLTPSTPAGKIALLRRATYDLTGLPPTPKDVDAYLADNAPNAFEKLIDRLLASSHYGEKWGRHWLDIVRYGETNGYERDGPKPEVWRYRDYVIRSFNADKPYDQFVKEQLAGDEMPGYNPDAIIATGYYRLGLWDDEPADPKLAMFDEFDDLVATTSQGILGMTMNCARCHDHKIDPIPQRDYYAMVAFFRDIKRFSNDRNPRSASNLTDISPPDVKATYEKEFTERRVKIAELTAQMEAIENQAIKKMSAEDQRASEGIDRPQVVKKVPMVLDADGRKAYQKLAKDRTELERKPNPATMLALSVTNNYVKPPTTNVLIRGNPQSPGAVVEPAFPEVLGFPKPTIPEPAKGAKSSGRRTVFADWITSKDNPMTARVMANRIWQNHFGRGIVSTPNDFGKFGTLPTHPELLDWLATELVDGGWKIKRLHKLIMMSSSYQRSAVATADALKADPGNMLFGRFTMRRLTAEEVRDSILAVSGQLNLKAGGPSIYPKIPKEVLAGQSVPGSGWHTSPPAEANRRSVYVHIKRSLQVPILAQYDQADADTTCPVRYTTTVPTQSLGMLNGEFSNEAAAAFAKRLEKEAADLDARIALAIRLTNARTPDADEVKRDREFFNELKTRFRLTDGEALRQYCLLCLNGNEFVYLD
jgi:mono/diheme cytochrome c family protein